MKSFGYAVSPVQDLTHKKISYLPDYIYNRHIDLFPGCLRLSSLVYAFSSVVNGHHYFVHAGTYLPA
jgi:hypothetical protein